MSIFIYCYPFAILPILLSPMLFEFLVRFVFLFLIILIILISSCTSSEQPFLLDSFQCFDDLRFWIIYVTIFLLLISRIIFWCVSKTPSFSPVIITILTCILFFSSSNFIEIYILYEFSLIPIVYIILKWGVYSERAKRALYILLYTIVFTLPMIIVLMYLFYSSSFLILYFTLSDGMIPYWVIFLLFIGFAVKLPLYGFHYWLPQAHVEAPTVGSIILAGLLLKLGGYGLVRMLFIVRGEFNTLLVSYVLVSVILVSVVTCYQADFKRLVAYSSVIHITAIVILLLGRNSISIKIYLFVIVFHGVLSPLIFYVVGLTYSLFKTRLLTYIGGIFSYRYLLYIVFVLVFLMAIPTPPFPQFFFEVLIFISVTNISKFVIVVLVIFTFLSLVLNLMWFVPTSLTGNRSEPMGQTYIYEILFRFYFILYMFILFSLIVYL